MHGHRLPSRDRSCVLNPDREGPPPHESGRRLVFVCRASVWAQLCLYHKVAGTRTFRIGHTRRMKVIGILVCHSIVAECTEATPVSDRNVSAAGKEHIYTPRVIVRIADAMVVVFHGKGAASISAVRPRLSSAFTSAPLSMSAAASSGWRLNAAQCNASARPIHIGAGGEQIVDVCKSGCNVEALGSCHACCHGALLFRAHGRGTCRQLIK